MFCAYIQSGFLADLYIQGAGQLGRDPGFAVEHRSGCGLNGVAPYSGEIVRVDEIQTECGLGVGDRDGAVEDVVDIQVGLDFGNFPVGTTIPVYR